MEIEEWTTFDLRDVDGLSDEEVQETVPNFRSVIRPDI